MPIPGSHHLVAREGSHTRLVGHHANDRHIALMALDIGNGGIELLIQQNQFGFSPAHRCNTSLQQRPEFVLVATPYSIVGPNLPDDQFRLVQNSKGPVKASHRPVYRFAADASVLGCNVRLRKQPPGGRLKLARVGVCRRRRTDALC